jgi:uncharacterized protein YecE (DUF72 family)
MNRLEPEIRIGCSGFSYSHWKHIFYPTETKNREQLEYFSSVFNTVEINSTFYQFPKASTVLGWYMNSAQDFKVTLKANSLITHVERFSKDAVPYIRKMYEYAAILKDKMGCFLFQFPPSFHYKEEHLNNIVKYLDPNYENVVEFRHSSWWNETAIKTLKEHNIIFSGTDGFSMPEQFYMANDTIYMRFHGYPHYRYKYKPHEIKIWARRFLRMKPKKIWIYWNNDRHGYAPDNAQELRRVLKEYLKNEEFMQKIEKEAEEIQIVEMKLLNTNKDKMDEEVPDDDTKLQDNLLDNDEEDLNKSTLETQASEAGHGEDVFWEDFETKFAFVKKKRRLN